MLANLVRLVEEVLLGVVGGLGHVLLASLVRTAVGVNRLLLLVRLLVARLRLVDGGTRRLVGETRGLRRGLISVFVVRELGDRRLAGVTAITGRDTAMRV